MSESGEHLTTSRISRIFRPLRAKCTALAAPISTSQPKHHAPIKYGSSTRSSVSASAYDHATSVTRRAFSFIPIPSQDRLALEYDTWSREFVRDLFMLSRKISDVRDMFRNLVKAAHGAWPDRSMAMSRPVAIPRLGAMCAIVVGVHLEDQAEADEDESRDGHEKGDNADVDALDEVYEAIPPHYRRHTMIAHALKYVLDNCAHYPTLLAALLDVTVAFRLVRETEQLLLLLCIAALQAPAGEPGLRILQHVNAEHFTSLYEKCCRSLLPGSYPLISDAGFAQILNSAISKAKVYSSTVWGCQTILSIVRGIRSRDFSIFMKMCTNVAVDITGRLAKKNTGEDMQLHLEKWLVVTLEHLSNGEDNSARYAIDFTSVVEFLVDMHTSKFTETGIAPGLRGLLLSLSAYCLSSPLLASFPEARTSLSDVFQHIAPETDTYHGLLRTLIPHDLFHCGPTAALPDIQGWADIFRRHGFYYHEASFCSAALRRVEFLLGKPSLSKSSSHTRLFRTLEFLRMELVDRVEESERLCFGATRKEDLGVAPVNASDWRWEEMVGCWVHRTPVVERKKPKLQRELSNLGIKATAAPSWPYATSETGSSRSFSSASTSSRSVSHSSMSPEFMEYEEHVIFTPPSSPSPSVEVESQSTLVPTHLQPHPKARRVSNFDSLLADAQSSCTVLHTPNSRRSSIPSHVQRPPVARPPWPEPVGDYSPSRQVEPSSDDLNLFAYSSPTVVRRR